MVQKIGRRRLLNIMTPLTVLSIRIIRPKNIEVITSNQANIDFTNSFIQINFPGGSIIT